MHYLCLIHEVWVVVFLHSTTYNESCYTGNVGTWGTSFIIQGKRLDNLVWKHSFEFHFHPSGSSFHILVFLPPLFSLPPIISSIALDENWKPSLRALPRRLQISSFIGCYLCFFILFFFSGEVEEHWGFWVTCFTKLDQIFSNSYS